VKVYVKPNEEHIAAYMTSLMETKMQANAMTGKYPKRFPAKLDFTCPYKTGSKREKKEKNDERKSENAYISQLSLFKSAQFIQRWIVNAQGGPTV